MDLQDFIAETIRQIMSGVSSAIKSHDVGQLGGIINPLPASVEDLQGQRERTSIDFNVAVTVESSTSGAKEGGLNIKVLEASLSKNSENRTVGESRVSFSVPVTLPYTLVNNA
ncbi:hypothetical protein [Novosphingobium naphthalenivorans]|uniref:hypothetical protein n=1 Tax=Novosphingobium naphthalenivorans TaxID=273168 RepID=UPI000AD1FD87|nr:hypothetical protein [Novosphingobium naphthalenivorans]